MGAATLPEPLLPAEAEEPEEPLPEDVAAYLPVRVTLPATS